MKKVFALILALCMVFALTACSVEITVDGVAPAAAEATPFAQVDETHWRGGSLTVESVETAEEYADYVDSTLFCNVTKIVYDGGEIEVDPALYTAILTVDGVQEDLYNAANVSFLGDCEITLVEKGNTASSGNSKFGDDAGSLIGPFAYTAAAYFDEDGYEEAKSVTAAQGADCVVTDTSVSGMSFVSDGDYFSAVYGNAGELTISDSDFIAYGKGGDDFTGEGCAVIASGEIAMTVEDSSFVTGGALRSAIWAGSKADVTVNNTYIQSFNDEELVPYSTEDNYATSMMQQCPFALGLTGNIRATLDCGQATIRFNDCLVASNGWAVLSTDSGNGTMIATDTVAVLGETEVANGEYDETFEVNGETYGFDLPKAGDLSGYIAYCDGFTDFAYGGRWFAPDYLAIITGGEFHVDESENARFYGYSDRIGFMSHKTSKSALLEVKNADFDVTDTFAMVKDAGGNGETINLENVTINLTGENAWSGKLLSFIDSDDLGGGPGATTFVIPYGDYDAYLNAGSKGASGEIVLNITDSELVGDVYDSVGSFNGTEFYEDSVTVNLVNSSLEGVVSSSYGVHCDPEGKLLVGDITVDSYEREGTYNYQVIGRMIDFAAPTVNNPVSLNLEGSVWTVTGLSYLKSLTLDKDSAVVGDLYQDGKQIEAKAGSYENVVAVPAGVALADAEAAAVDAIADATAAGIVPVDASGLVNNVDMGGMGASSEPAAEEASEEPASEEPASEEPASAEPAADESGYPHFDEYRDYVAEFIQADDFMVTTPALDDTYAATDPYNAPFIDINPVIGSMDYADWMAANYPGEAFPAE